MNDKTVEVLLERFDKLEQKITALPDKSWTLEDCAHFMQCSYATAFRMSKLPGFPKATKPQTNEKGSLMVGRYDPEEFKTWFYSRANRAS